MSKCPSIANGLPFCGHRGEQTKSSVGFRITAIALGILAVSAALCALFGVPLISQIGTTYSWTLFSVGALFVLVAASIKCVKNEPSTEGSPPQNGLPIDQPKDTTDQVVKQPSTDLLPPPNTEDVAKDELPIDQPKETADQVVEQPPTDQLPPPNTEDLSKDDLPIDQPKETADQVVEQPSTGQLPPVQDIDNVPEMSVTRSKIVELYNKKYPPSTEKKYTNHWLGLPNNLWQGYILRQLDDKSTHCLSMVNSHFALLLERLYKKELEPKSTSLTHSSWTKQHTQLSGGWLLPSAAKENKIKYQHALKTNEGWFDSSVTFNSKIFVANLFKDKKSVIHIYDLTTGELEKTLESPSPKQIHKLYVTDTSLIAIYFDGCVQTWDAKTYEGLKTFQAFDAISCSLVKEKMLAVGSSNGADIQIWNIETATLSKTLKVSGIIGPSASALQYNDGKLISRDSDNQNKIWDLEKGELISKFKSAGDISQLFVAGDKLITVSTNALIIDLATQQVKHSIAIRQGGFNVHRICFSINKDFIAAADAGAEKVAVWDVHTGEKLFEQSRDTRHLNAFRPRPTYCPVLAGNTFLLADDNEIKIWDIRTNELLRTINHGIVHPHTLQVVGDRIILQNAQTTVIYEMQL